MTCGSRLQPISNPGGGLRFLFILLLGLSLAACDGGRDAETVTLSYSPVADGHVIVHSENAFRLPLEIRIYGDGAAPLRSFSLEQPWHKAQQDRTAAALELVNLPAGWMRIEIDRGGWFHPGRFLVPISNNVPMPVTEDPPWHWILRHPWLAGWLLAFALYLLSAASTGALFVTQGASSLCILFLICFCVAAGHWAILPYLGYILCLVTLILIVPIGAGLNIWLRSLIVFLPVAGMLLLHMYRDYEPQAGMVAPGILRAYVPAKPGTRVSLQDEQVNDLPGMPLRPFGQFILLLEQDRLPARLVVSGPEGSQETLEISD